MTKVVIDPFQNIKAMVRRWVPASLLTFLRRVYHRSGGMPVRYVQVEKWKDDLPLVSVVIPCFNHGEYLPEAVDSILAQTWQNFEIIAIDDGSTSHETRTVMETFERPKTRVLFHPENLGLPAARNTGIQEARGKYICCLDADDKLESTYLEKALLLLESNQGISFVYPWTQVFGKESRVWRAPQFDAAELLQRNQLNPPAVFRRSAWEATGGFREEMRKGYEDWEFWIRLAGLGLRGHCIPERLLLVRRVGRSFIDSAYERHAELVGDIRRYNSHLYEDPDWPEQVKRLYQDLYARNPCVNLADPADYLPLENPAVWVNHLALPILQARLTNIQDKMQKHAGDVIFVSLTPVDPDTEDALRLQAKYFYDLPRYIPPYSWAQFLNLLRARLPKNTAFCNVT
jgi:glycosyltransferase involved in cell wall biosynthesis